MYEPISMVLKERMRVVVQGMGIMDVLCDAIYNILKLKILKLFINMELLKNYVTSVQWNIIQL